MSMTVRALIVASLTALAVGQGVGTAVAVAGTATVLIDESLQPKRLTVAPGTRVRWINRDDERHRMRSRGGPVEWDSKNLEPGDSFTYTFTVEGTYRYIDEREDDDTDYHGTIVVASAGGSGPFGGGSDEGSSDTGSAPASSATVRMAGRSFSPSTVTLAAGGSISWVNDDDDEHTVNASAGGSASGTLNPGARFTRRFVSAGTYDYFCAFHADMTGTVLVQAPNGRGPPGKQGVDEGNSPPADAAAASRIEIVDLAFAPSSVRIRAGGTVVWANEGVAPHTVTAEEGSFDSGTLEPGARFRRTFATAGTYEYVCTIHPAMTGTVVVGAATVAPGVPTPRPSTSLAASVESSVSRAPVAARAPLFGTGALLGTIFGIPAALFISAMTYLRSARARDVNG